MPMLNENGELQLFVLFFLGEKMFAVNALFVQEIVRVGVITPVHNSPKHLLGITNLRGRLVSVIDPAQRVGLDPQVPSEETEF